MQARPRPAVRGPLGQRPQHVARGHRVTGLHRRAHRQVGGAQLPVDDRHRAGPRDLARETDPARSRRHHLVPLPGVQVHAAVAGEPRPGRRVEGAEHRGDAVQGPAPGPGVGGGGRPRCEDADQGERRRDRAAPAAGGGCVRGAGGGIAEHGLRISPGPTRDEEVVTACGQRSRCDFGPMCLTSRRRGPYGPRPDSGPVRIVNGPLRVEPHHARPRALRGRGGPRPRSAPHGGAAERSGRQAQPRRAAPAALRRKSWPQS